MSSEKTLIQIRMQVAEMKTLKASLKILEMDMTNGNLLIEPNLVVETKVRRAIEDLVQFLDKQQEDLIAESMILMGEK